MKCRYSDICTLEKKINKQLKNQQEDQKEKKMTFKICKEQQPKKRMTPRSGSLSLPLTLSFPQTSPFIPPFSSHSGTEIAIAEV